MSIEKYYDVHFNNDLKILYSDIPESSLHHNGKETYTIQYERLTNKYNHLIYLGDNRTLFITSLYFTVLLDQIFYTYFQSEYKAYRELTNSPKFIGNCLSSCRYNLHPKNVINAANKDRVGEYVVYKDTFKNLPLIEDKTSQVLKSRFPSIQNDFFDKLRKEI